eukprot:792824-Prymnesium_polylepis.1
MLPLTAEALDRVLAVALLRPPSAPSFARGDHSTAPTALSTPAPGSSQHAGTTYAVHWCF